MSVLQQSWAYFAYGKGFWGLVLMAGFFALAATIGFIRLANAIKWVLEKIAFASGWLLIALMFTTCIGITARKFSIPIPLTKFQEMEWHLHTIIFSAWMGYNYTINAHPRVDSYTETFQYRSKAWVEFWLLLIFALPFMWVVVHHGWDFFWTSYVQGERSENAIGLDSRWIIKGIFYLGNWLVLLGVMSVLLRLIVLLFGGKSQEETQLQIGHAELEV
jgi:TRAP-type mannitol/chloroaromatic compound transport system permease small subunit